MKPGGKVMPAKKNQFEIPGFKGKPAGGPLAKGGPGGPPMFKGPMGIGGPGKGPGLGKGPGPVKMGLAGLAGIGKPAPDQI